MKTIKLLSKVVVLLFFVALATYAGYYYLVKTSIDRQLQQMRPFVDAQYDSLYVNPLGDIRLNTVTLDLMGQPGGLIVDRVSLKSDPLFFLQFDSRVSQGDWPESLTFAIEGMNVDFSMPLFLMLEQLVQPAEGVQLAALGCGRVSQFDMTALRMMGMRQGRFDFYINLNNQASPLNLQILAMMHGWGEMVIDFDLTGLVGLQQAANFPPELQRVAMSVKDMGYNQRKNQFCAMQSGVTIPEYREVHQTMVNDWITQTMIPVPESLIHAYHQLSEPGASFSVQFHTSGINQHALLSPDQFMEHLSSNVAITVNNQLQSLEGDGLQLMMALMQHPVILETPDLLDEPEYESDAPRSMPGVASPPVQAVPSIVPRRYLQTDPEDLVNYVGHPVRFFTSFGKRVDGILVSVDGSTVRVAERVQHGTAQYPVELNTIQATEVYR